MRERVKKEGDYVSFKTGTISFGGREKKSGRMSKRDSEVCVRRVLAAVRGEAMAAGLQDGGQSF